MKKFTTYLLTFLAGVVATIIVALRIADTTSKVALKAASITTATATTEYKQQIAQITKEVKSETKQQIIDGFMSRFSKPLPTDSTNSSNHSAS